MEELDLRNANKIDPLKRMVERQTDQEEFSPMDPPDAYAPPAAEDIPFEDLHPFLKSLMEEHKDFIKELDLFEEVLVRIKEDGMKAEFNKPLGSFFQFLDTRLVKHNLKEEKLLFPELHRLLLESGQHSKGPEATTAIDMLEDDHVKLMQLSAVTFNFFGLAGRLPNPESRAIVLDAALEQGKGLVEMLKLHIFREDNVVFLQAQKEVPKEIFDAMFEKLNLFA